MRALRTKIADANDDIAGNLALHVHVVLNDVRSCIDVVAEGVVNGRQGSRALRRDGCTLKVNGYCESRERHRDLIEWRREVIAQTITTRLVNIVEEAES